MLLRSALAIAARERLFPAEYRAKRKLLPPGLLCRAHAGIGKGGSAGISEGGF